MAKGGSPPGYPIRAAARLTGLSVDTLRAWERRYRAVTPARGTRGRVYTSSDLARLKQLAALVARGHAIGTIAGLSNAELTRLLAHVEAPSAAPREAAADLTPLLAALDRYDLPALESALARFAAVLPPRELVLAVTLPLLRELGARWEAGTLRPAQEHLVSATIRSVLGGLLRALARPEARPRVVFATPAGERHELGLLCAAILAASDGCGVVYLGPDLPAADIAHAVRTTDAAALVIGATTQGAVTRSEARSLGKAVAGVEVLIGGADASSLVAEVGAARHVASLADLVPMLARAAGRAG